MERSTLASPNHLALAVRSRRSRRRLGATRGDEDGKGPRTRPRPTESCAGNQDQDRIAYAKWALEEMVLEAVSGGCTGTIGVEIPIKDGKLGRVKRLQIDYQPD